ncbi:MAG: flavin reductase family protein [Planctomycetes bacterium]|nr:flavin reductase family protein [Planctomycetota bacterium]
MIIDPSQISISDRYKLLIGGITPRPIALVSTASPAGRLNLAPFSFFAGVGSNPLTLLFCPVNNPNGTEKDSLRNAKTRAEGGTGQFVVNVVSHRFARQMAASAEELPYEQSEFELSGLQQAPSSRVAPPRVADAAMAFECETRQVIRTNPGQPGGGNIVIGEVVSVFIRDDAAGDRLHIDPDVLDTVGRMAGTTYCLTRDRFELPMGRKALSGESPEAVPPRGPLEPGQGR